MENILSLVAYMNGGGEGRVDVKTIMEFVKFGHVTGGFGPNMEDCWGRKFHSRGCQVTWRTTINLWNSWIWSWEGLKNSFFQGFRGENDRKQLWVVKNNSAFWSECRKGKYWRGTGIYSVDGMHPFCRLNRWNTWLRFLRWSTDYDMDNTMVRGTFNNKRNGMIEGWICAEPSSSLQGMVHFLHVNCSISTFPTRLYWLELKAHINSFFREEVHE